MDPQAASPPSPLAEAYPALAALPRAGLLAGPTPVAPLPGLDGVWIKRDDLTASDYGGNKIRKLDFLLGDARARGRRSLTVFGYAGSNFVAATAWHARKLGMHTMAGLLPQRPALYVVDNLSVSLYCGAELFVRAREPALIADAALRSARELALGRLPYWIPPGGSNALGALGFVEAALELHAQIVAGLLPSPERLYVAFSSMGTVAGLATGLALAGLPTRLVAVQVVGAGLAGSAALAQRLERLRRRLARHGVDAPAVETLLGRIDIRTGFYGGEYALATPAVQAALRRFTVPGARADSAYSGKALACLYADRDAGAREPALYWHTFSAIAKPPGVRRAEASDAPAALRGHWLYDRLQGDARSA